MMASERGPEKRGVEKVLLTIRQKKIKKYGLDVNGEV